MTTKNKKVKAPKTKAEKKLFRQRLLAYFLIFCVSIVTIGSTGVVLFASSANKKAPEMKADDFYRKESTKVLAEDGSEIYETGQKIIENVTYDDLPQVMIDALVSIEDSRFFIHDGVDVPRFTKAMITNGLDTIKNRRLMFSQGGSTLTMQLIKNTYFTYENTETNEVVEAASSGIEGVERKFQELKLARQAEREGLLTKQETMALYLNTANFGAQENIIGVQNSAEKYFGKDVKDLSLVESAFLAGVLNAPEYYTPYKSIENARERTQDVLYYMNYHGYITDEEYKIAQAIDLENLLKPIDKDTRDALPNQAYIDVVLDEVRELVKDSEGNAIDATVGGMRIYTAMNPDIQAGIDKVQRREIASMDQGASTNIQLGATVINNKTGEIVGVAGGYDYKGERIFNNAKDAYTMPASVVKPVLDYALAFEYLGWATTHVVTDAPYTYAGTNILVGNYDGRFLGEITLMHAVADSRNTTALKALDDVLSAVGRETVVNYMQSIGFSRVNMDNFSNQFAIGGNEFETTTLELAGAYQAVMNNGNYIKPHTITRIEFENGREPITNSPSATNVLSDASAYMAAQTMKYAVEGPWPGYLRSVKKPYTVYGKTGTNRYTPQSAPAGAPHNSQRDRLMIAATSDFTTATWIGFTKYDPELKPWITAAEADFNMTGKMSSYLLDLVQAAYGTPGAIARPSSVVDIQHILGTFPYQVPLADMNPDLISKGGMIKKDFLNLVEAQPQELENLKSSDVKASQDGENVKITVDMSPYPDEEKLTIAEPYISMPMGGSTIQGARIYDPSWVFGAVRYKSEVEVDGVIVEETMSDSPQHTYNLKINHESKVLVRSYYTYDLSLSRKSNALVSEIKLEKPVEPEIQIGTYTGKDVSEFNQFLNKRQLSNVSYKEVKTNNLREHDVIDSINPKIDNTKTTLSELKKLTLNVTLRSFEFTLSNTTAKDFSDQFKSYMEIRYDQANKDKVVKGLDFGNGRVNSFKLNDVQGKTVTLIFED